MKQEKSCGAVVFTKVNGKIEYLLIEGLGGIFGFPKGHVERGETELETAQREICEETGLNVDFVGDFRMTDKYIIHKGNGKTLKTVVYFLAYFDGQEIVRQESEIKSIVLLGYDEAMKQLQFERLRLILTEANKFLITSKGAYKWNIK